MFYYKEALLRLFYPENCGICSVSVPLNHRYLCHACGQKLKGFELSWEETLLNQSFQYLDNAWALYPYASPVKELLLSIKYQRKNFLINVFNRSFSSFAQAITSDYCYDSILPVPITRFKLMERHFNQSELIADMIKKYVHPSILKNLLIKYRNTPPQNLLTQAERAINLYGAFKIKRSHEISEKSFLLIDDIVTTGSTANELARILKENGAKRVDLLTIAKALEKNNTLTKNKNILQDTLS